VIGPAGDADDALLPGVYELDVPTSRLLGIGIARRQQDHPTGHDAHDTGITAAATGRIAGMKKLLELLVCFIHPLAVVLAWVNLAGRSDLGTVRKLVWAVFMIVPIVPFIYVLTGGDLW
jgi:hypothetical protein